MAWSLVTPSMSAVSLHTSSSSSPNSLLPFTFHHTNTTNLKSYTSNSKQHPCYSFPIYKTSHFFSKKDIICRAAEYQFPDPIPEFADSETEKFKAHLLKKLSKKDIYGDELDEVVGICTEIFSKFLHEEYGGPGTLLVLPFIDMADTLNESGLNGGPQAARAAVKWAQANVDKDWRNWANGSYSKDP